VELREAIVTRRTVRAYRQEPVAAELLEELLRQASAAPSACDRRGWKFILISNPADFHWLYSHGGSSVLRSAGQAILVCYQQNTDNAEWQDNIQSAAAVIAYFQLLAHESDIGTCWICHLPPKMEVARYFAVPPAYVPIAVVSCGYYQEGRAAGNDRRRTAERIMASDRWDFAVESAEQPSFAFRCRKLCRAIYYSLPFRSLFRGWANRFEKKFDD